VLQDGDLLLTFAGAVQSWGVVLCTDPNAREGNLPYSHVEMLYRDRHGKWMIAGISGGRLSAQPFVKALWAFQHAGVFRANLPLAQRRKTVKVMTQWLQDPEIRKAEFDYALQDVPGRRDAFCCVGLINEIHREAGLDVPFVTQAWTPNAFGRHLEKLLDIQFEKITAVDSLKQNPRYSCITEWHNNRRDPIVARINETLARLGFQWYEQGWRLRASEGIHLGLLLVNPPDNLDRAMRTQTHILSMTEGVQGAWLRLMRRGQLKGLDEAAKQDKLETICEFYRDRHMVFVDPSLESVRVQESTTSLTP
jgi:hypothetical protein